MQKNIMLNTLRRRKIGDDMMKMKIKQLFEEVLKDESEFTPEEQQLLDEAKISDLMKKDSSMLTKSEKNRLAKFKANLNTRESENMKWKDEEDYKKRADKYKNAKDKVGEKAGQSGVTVHTGRHYR
jgi:cytochrome c556